MGTIKGMRSTILFLTLAGLHAQTRVPNNQLIVPPTVSQEEKWCPGPSMVVAADRLSFMVGSRWSITTPCYVHFNITPPAQVDPVSVMSFVEAFQVTIKPGFTGDDEVYLFAMEPGFAPPVPAKIGVRVRNVNAVTCGGCGAGVTQDSRLPRMFPARSVPIGFVEIRGGKFRPKPDELLSRQQVYIGPGVEMAMRADQGGYWFEVSAAQAQIATMAQRTAELQGVTAAAAAKQIWARPVPTEQVATLEKRITEMERSYMELHGRVPPTAQQTQLMLTEFEQAREEIRGRLGMVYEDLHMQTRGMQQQLMQELDQTMYVQPPATPTEVCVHPRNWSRDTKYLYRCLAAAPYNQAGAQPEPPLNGVYWLRIQIDTKWK